MLGFLSLVFVGF